MPIASARLGRTAPVAIASHPCKSARKKTPRSPPARRPSGSPRSKSWLASASATYAIVQNAVTSTATAAALAATDSSTGHRIREYEFESTRLLLSGERPRSGADRKDDRKQRQHEAEELRVHEPGSARDVDSARESEERLQCLWVVLEQVADVRRPLDGREDRRQQDDVESDADAPAKQRAPVVAQAAPKELNGDRCPLGRARGRSPPGRRAPRRGRRVDAAPPP